MLFSSPESYWFICNSYAYHWAGTLKHTHLSSLCFFVLILVATNDFSPHDGYYHYGCQMMPRSITPKLIWNSAVRRSSLILSLHSAFHAFAFEWSCAFLLCSLPDVCLCIIPWFLYWVVLDLATRSLLSGFLTSLSNF